MASNKLLLPVYSGGYVDMECPQPDQIRLEDIARSHANCCRYLGHSTRPYFIAEHAVRVALACGAIYGYDTMKEGLLHDAAEAYLGEVVRMLKHSDLMAGYRLAEVTMDEVVRSRFGLNEHPDPRIKAVDWAIVHSEITSGLFPYPSNLLHINGQWSDRPLQKEVAAVFTKAPSIPGFWVNIQSWGWGSEQAFAMFMLAADWLGVK